MSGVELLPRLGRRALGVLFRLGHGAVFFADRPLLKMREGRFRHLRGDLGVAQENVDRVAPLNEFGCERE